MIDDMVVLLGEEQKNDDKEKDFCNEEFDKSEDQQKELKRKIGQLETQQAEMSDAIATLKDDIAALVQGIKDLDKAVAEATVQRKDEHAEWAAQSANDAAVIQLIEVAKNRLNKFYNPKLYKPPPKRELSEEERITLNMGGTLAPTNPPGGIAGTGVSFLAANARGPAPPPPPEAPGAYKKKGEESGGVIAMMDMMKKEVETEMQEAEFT